MSETQFQVGDFVVFDHNVDGPIYEVERLDEMFIVIRDENDDLQSVDPATLTLYGRRGLLTESLGSVARKSARIAELERENAELRGRLLLLAKLSADTPQFYNPLEAMAAKLVRDEILAAARAAAV